MSWQWPDHRVPGVGKVGWGEVCLTPSQKPGGLLCLETTLPVGLFVLPPCSLFTPGHWREIDCVLILCPPLPQVESETSQVKITASVLPPCHVEPWAAMWNQKGTAICRRGLGLHIPLYRLLLGMFWFLSWDGNQPLLCTDVTHQLSLASWLLRQAGRLQRDTQW